MAPTYLPVLHTFSIKAPPCSGGRLSVCPPHPPLHFAMALFPNSPILPYKGFCVFLQVEFSHVYKCPCAHISPSMPRALLAVPLFFPILLFSLSLSQSLVFKKYHRLFSTDKAEKIPLIQGHKNIFKE